jgi:hypothetical protein
MFIKHPISRNAWTHDLKVIAIKSGDVIAVSVDDVKGNARTPFPMLRYMAPPLAMLN